MNSLHGMSHTRVSRSTVHDPAQSLSEDEWNECDPFAAAANDLGGPEAVSPVCEEQDDSQTYTAHMHSPARAAPVQRSLSYTPSHQQAPQRGFHSAAEMLDETVHQEALQVRACMSTVCMHRMLVRARLSLMHAETPPLACVAGRERQRIR